MTPVKDLGDDADEIASWLFWRGSSDGTISTTIVLYDPPGLQGTAAAASAALNRVFVETAKELMRFSNLRFASVRSAAVFEDFELPVDSAHVAMYMQHDEGKVVLGAEDASESKAKLINWIMRHDVPLVLPIGITHRNLLNSRKRVSHLGLFFVTAEQVSCATVWLA